MENTGFVGLLRTIWQRVFLSYKSTGIAILIAVGDQIVAFYSGPQYPAWVHQVVWVLSAILVFMKEPKKPGTGPVLGGPIGLIGLVLLGSLTSCAFFQRTGQQMLECNQRAYASAHIVDVINWLGDANKQDELLAIGVQEGRCLFEVAIAEMQRLVKQNQETRAQGGTALLISPIDYTLEIQRAKKLIAKLEAT